MQIDAFTTDRLSPSHSLRGWQSYRLTARGFVIQSARFRAVSREFAHLRFATL